MRKLTYSLFGLALAATAAHAQPAPDPAAPAESAVPAGPAAPSDAVPPADLPAPDASAPDASTADSAEISDAQIDQFAAATVKLQEIDADATIAADQKQEQMAAVVTEAGLDPATYNKIGRAIAVDPELRSKVQVAMARHGGSAPADPTDG